MFPSIPALVGRVLATALPILLYPSSSYGTDFLAQGRPPAVARFFHHTPSNTSSCQAHLTDPFPRISTASTSTASSPPSIIRVSRSNPTFTAPTSIIRVSHPPTASSSTAPPSVGPVRVLQPASTLTGTPGSAAPPPPSIIYVSRAPPARAPGDAHAGSPLGWTVWTSFTSIFSDLIYPYIGSSACLAGRPRPDDQGHDDYEHAIVAATELFARKRPGVLLNTQTNAIICATIVVHWAIRRIAGFSNAIFLAHAPALHRFYEQRQRLLFAAANRSDVTFFAQATAADLVEREPERAQRWENGLRMFKVWE
ncbi:hypothetical protein MSAN_00789300 [Mycena sanguinolenta]|uniref:Uncharacterized protein n=1 Tax=Mycena sanguinolenta TaxID=230812 RepID=A0A8H7DCP0_9AGAR|nr:hypothetical protein MSAN_00789300 [Mycena sanguinolenta]